MSTSSAALMYLASADNPSEEGYEAYAKHMGIAANSSDIYKLAARFAKFLLSGKAVEKKIGPADVDPKELAMGLEVEKEHAGDDVDIARRISLDHLAEFSNYYTALKFMEEMLGSMEKEAGLGKARNFVASVKNYVLGNPEKADQVRRITDTMNRRIPKLNPRVETLRADIQASMPGADNPLHPMFQKNLKQQGVAAKAVQEAEIRDSRFNRFSDHSEQGKKLLNTLDPEGQGLIAENRRGLSPDRILSNIHRVSDLENMQPTLNRFEALVKSRRISYL